MDLDDRMKSIHQWALRNTAEHMPLDELDQILVAPDIESLVYNLDNYSGLQYIVLGLQGVGKTTLHAYLGEKLGNSLSIRYDGTKKVKSLVTSDNRGAYIMRLWDAIIARLQFREHFSLTGSLDVFERVSNALKLNNAQRDLVNKLRIENKREFTKLEPLVPIFEKFLGMKYVKEIVDELSVGTIIEYDTVLFDFPDYPQGNVSAYMSDFRKFQAFLDQSITLNLGNIGDAPNVVIFWQKENFGEHHLFGKYTPIEIERQTSSTLVNYYQERFHDLTPFNRESLMLIAGLARGVWRWFKQYIGKCLDKYRVLPNEIGPFSIDIQHVKKWITDGEIYDSWQRELRNIFSRSVELQRVSVKLLRYLLEHGPTKQSILTEEFFGLDDASNQKCSRVLSQLENVDYVSRFMDGREKVVRSTIEVNPNEE